MNDWKTFLKEECSTWKEVQPLQYELHDTLLIGWQTYNRGRITNKCHKNFHTCHLQTDIKFFINYILPPFSFVIKDVLGVCTNMKIEIHVYWPTCLSLLQKLLK